MVNIFEILGIEPGADPQLVRSAFRDQVRLLHPDLSAEAADGDDTHRYRELVAAWATYVSEDRDRTTESGDTAAVVVETDHETTGSQTSFVVEGALESVAESVYIVASWLGDPYHSDLPTEFDMIVQDPFDAFCAVTLSVADVGICVSLDVRRRLGSAQPDASAVRARFVAELQTLADGDR